MQQFIAKFRDQITGVISGFDRLIFRGVLRRLVYSRGMEQYLWQNQILFKDYACHVKKVSQRIKNASLELFHAQRVPVVYLPSPKTMSFWYLVDQTVGAQQAEFSAQRSRTPPCFHLRRNPGL